MIANCRACWIFGIVCAMLLAGSANAQRELKTIPDPDPELERRSFQVADGFEVNLFAADPLLAKPIQMNFDAAGRLWVACSEVYPQIKPGQTANDKIIILEDTDGDGKADKTTVFADGLLIPTGIEPGNRGAYVANSTDLEHLTRDKDGSAVRRRIMLSGFGTEDTHHILHTFRWGPDGMLYFNQSIYIHSHIETPHGVRRLEAGGVWQFRPDTMQLEVFLRGFCNPWGHSFDRWGQSFITDGAYGEGINYGLPGASYVFAKDSTRILAGLNPGSPKHCGLEILSGRHLPESWRGNALTNDFRGHRVCRFVLREDGAGYTSQEMPELIKTNHAAFRPVDVKMGPDGAIYIADWYNPIIQHGEVDFRDPRRDHTHGRIWRVTAKGRPLVKRPVLAGASVETLLDSLKEPEDWTRHFAKRALKDNYAAVLAALKSWIARLDRTEPDYEHHLLEGLWTYQTFDVVEPGLLNTLLHARDHHARAAAVRVLRYWHARLPNALELLAERITDSAPQVRLEAIRALGQVNDPRAAEVAMQALERPMDKWLDYALWLTARELEPYWMPALQAGRLNFDGNVRHLLFALQAAGSSAAVGPLMRMVQNGKISREQETAVLTLIAGLGGSEPLRLVFERMLGADLDSPRQSTLLAALAQAAQQRGVRPSGDVTGIARLLAAHGEPDQISAISLIGLWRVDSLRARLAELVSDSERSEAARWASLEALAHLGGRESRDILEQLADSRQPLKFRMQAVIALAAVDQQTAAKCGVNVLAAANAGADPTDVYLAFLQRKNGAEALARALAGHKLPADIAKIGVRSARASGRDSPALVEALTKAGTLTAGLRVLSPAEMQQMMKEIAEHGNAARGEAVFRRSDLACLKCHAIAGAGGLVGPDLVSIGASAQVDYLIESILQPNKAVKENYHSLVVATKDGRLFTGIKVRESKEQLVLRDAEDREVAIPVRSIDDKAVGSSLMPEGLADPLTRAELVDLVRFLSELGKVGPYSVSKAKLVRRWQVLEPTPAAYSLIWRTRIASVTSPDPGLVWNPVYSQVSGILPLDGIPRLTFNRPESKGSDVLGFVRCQVDVSRGGKVRMLLNSAAGLTLWLDGTPLEAKAENLLEVKPGVHTLTFAIDLQHRHEGLRCEFADAPGSATRFQIVSGK
ncbi:MAG TPA: PVC-type heme-binding CxxCH protein [Gemmataceae bacterium]|nr:PVC-type heme-binding CxxCH protein [Gemmataceae bacterium]